MIDEKKIINAISDRLTEYAKQSITVAYGTEVNLPYAVGLRQGTYNGLTLALQYVSGIIEAEANKEKLL